MKTKKHKTHNKHSLSSSSSASQSIKKTIKHKENVKGLYTILPYTYKQAHKLNVKIEHSDKPKYKLKVITPKGDVIYCGAKGYNDYPTYWKKYGKEFADKRRKLYKIRHNNDRHRIGTPGYYADKLLW